MTVELRELEYAVCDVIQIIKQIPELAESRLAVIGGLALWHYLPGHRPTDVRPNFFFFFQSFRFYFGGISVVVNLIRE